MPLGLLEPASGLGVQPDTEFDTRTAIRILQKRFSRELRRSHNWCKNE